MISELTVDDFLLRNRITKETWAESSLKWDTLIEIAQDYERYSPQLSEYAGMLARVVQQYDGVHSVRWRIKDIEHVLEKIVRKCAAGSGKYQGINANTYYLVITDLIGIRALHLFKEEALNIDASLRENQELIGTEKPLVYTRKGDAVSVEVFPPDRFEHSEHPAGYRSVHYIIQSQPQKRQVFAEVQVRTIFEEGWSEIDHRVRYPNFTSDEMVNVFLAIFNRLAGQADEMGSFVQTLAQVSSATQAELKAAHEEKRASLEAMDALVFELGEKAEEHAQSQSTIAKLKKELARMRSAAETAETRTGSFSDVWKDHFQRGSEMAKQIARMNSAAEASSIFSESLITPQQLSDLSSINSLVESAAGIYGFSNVSIPKLGEDGSQDKKNKGGGKK